LFVNKWNSPSILLASPLEEDEVDANNNSKGDVHLQVVVDAEGLTWAGKNFMNIGSHKTAFLQDSPGLFPLPPWRALR
jgi:hypothetical protein